LPYRFVNISLIEPDLCQLTQLTQG